MTHCLCNSSFGNFAKKKLVNFHMSALFHCKLYFSKWYSAVLLPSFRRVCIRIRTQAIKNQLDDPLHSSIVVEIPIIRERPGQTKYLVGGGLEKQSRFFLDYSKMFSLAVKTTCFTQYLSYLNPKEEASSCKIDGFMTAYVSN